MSNTTQNHDHRQLLEDLLKNLEAVELPFYEREAKFHYFAWYATATLAFITSVAAVAAASFVGVKEFESYGKILLIVLPTIGTIASGLLNLYKFKEKEALREEGRIELEDLIFCAKSLQASAKDDEAFKNAFHAVRERFKTLTLAQHRADTTLRSTDVLTDSTKSKP